LRTLRFSRKLVLQPLLLPIAYAVRPNASYDRGPAVDDEITFPGDSIPLGFHLGPWDAARAEEFLFRKERVPEWINVSVLCEQDGFVVIELLCCGRFTAGRRLLYHVQEGIPPFHVLGPALPPGWETLDASGSFDLHWRRAAVAWYVEEPTPG